LGFAGLCLTLAPSERGRKIAEAFVRNANIHRTWIEDWLPRRDNRKAALVALIAGDGEPESQAAPMLAYLQRAARLARMDFFNHAFDLPRPEREFSVQQITERARAVTPLLQDILHQKMPNPRWGINE